MESLSVGVIGAGAISRQSHLPVLTTMPQVRVAWIADVNLERAKALARAYKVEPAELPASPADLPECQAVLLAIPVGARRAYLEALAERRVGVLVEKPFARTVAEHSELIDAFPRHLLACGFMRRMYASTSLLRTAVKANWFGPLVEIRAFEGGRTTATRTDKSFLDVPEAIGGGILAESGSHALDQALYITQASSYEVIESRTTVDGSIDRKAQGRLNLSVPGSQREVAFRFCFSWLDRQSNTLELEFESVILVTTTDPESPILMKGTAAHGGGTATLVPERGARTSSVAFRLEWEDFLQAMSEKRESTISAASCLSTTALIEDLYVKARFA